MPAPYRHANANANDDTGVHTGAVGAGTVSATNPWGTPRKPEWKYFEYSEGNSYDFSIYGEEEYRRDRYGDKAPRAHLRRRRDQERLQPRCP